MKKTIILLIIIAAIGALIYFKGHTSVKTLDVDKPVSTTASGHPDMSNATYNIENEDVTLKSGSNTSPIAPDSELSVDTRLADIIGYGDLNNDGKEDAVGIIVQSGGGSGVFVYIAGYVSAPVTYKGTNAIFVGDRISPESIKIENGVITLNYLDRGSDESFAADPTIETTKQFVYKSGELQEK